MKDKIKVIFESIGRIELLTAKTPREMIVRIRRYESKEATANRAKELEKQRCLKHSA